MNGPTRWLRESAQAARRTRFEAAATGAFWYALIVAVIPLASLALFGLFALWRDGQLLTLLLLWLATTVLGYGFFIVLPDRRARKAQAAAREKLVNDANDAQTELAAEDLPEQLDERADWSERDREIWSTRCLSIEALLEEQPAWEQFPRLAAEELSAVANAYHGPGSNARLRFTVPEGLLVTAVASERYRRVVSEHVPFIDRITVASLITLHGHSNTLRTGARWLDRVRRVARLSNPIGAAVGELRDQLTNRMLSETGSSLQRDLKRLLLQEVAQVGIDLYSGRLKVSDAELSSYLSEAVRADANRTPEAVEPLRVVLVGQVSAGKSSLVNALAKTLEAEIDPLPTTDRTSAHALSVGDGVALHVIDTSGLDDDAQRARQLVDTATEADLIVWVARVTQPARAPDQQLLELLQQWFSAHPARRKPPVILALTHVDHLPPRNEWAPPYPLADVDGTASDSPPGKKAANIRQALLSVRRSIGLDPDTPAVPLCLHAPAGSADSTYNVDALAAEILSLVDAATLAQFNRRRVERGAATGGWRSRLTQTRNLGVAVGRRWLKRAGHEDSDNSA